MHYCVVKFQLQVLDGDDGYQGKHNMLKLIEHSSVPLSPRQRAYNLQQSVARKQLCTEMSELHSLLDDDVSQQAQRQTYPLPLVRDFRFYRQFSWNPTIPRQSHFN